MIATVDNLSSIMEFDHVIRVHEDGTVTDEPGIYAPELYDFGHPEGFERMFLVPLDGTDWELLNGFSRQDRYSGPIMHDSEYIGGGLAEFILNSPGVYVALVSSYSPDSESDEFYIEGWAIARLKEDPT